MTDAEEYCTATVEYTRSIYQALYSVDNGA